VVDLPDDARPIMPPHRDLAEPRPSADAPVLLHDGPLTGVWTDVQALRAEFGGLPNQRALVEQFSTGRDGRSVVAFYLAPEPHVRWFFQSEPLPFSSGWPTLVPPTEITPFFGGLYT